MRRLLRALAYGRALRHRPVALRPSEQQPVRAMLGERDVTAALFPVARDPLLFGLVREPGASPVGEASVLMRDAASGALLGGLEAVSAGVFEHPGGAVDLLRPVASSADCVAPAERAWRYALAWRRARRGRGFGMGFADMRALDVLYLAPRPVFLLSLAHEGAGNAFTIDLVGSLGPDSLLMALHRSNPSLDDLRASGRFVLGAVPAEWKERLEPLGEQHHKRSVEWDALPFAVAPSPAFGVPAAVDALDLRELAVTRCESVGSYVLLACAIVSASPVRDAPQLCHVSDSYARWRAARGRAFADA